MLVALIGPQCAGKDTIAKILVEQQKFIRVRVGIPARPLESNPTASPSRPQAPELFFEDVGSFLQYATLHWLDDFITTDLLSREKVEPFVKRPWFLAVSVEVGVIERWRRAVHRTTAASEPVPSLESFVAADDLATYGPPPPIPSIGTRTLPQDYQANSPLHVQVPHGDLPASSLLLPPSGGPGSTPPITSPASNGEGVTSNDDSGLESLRQFRRRVTPLRELISMASYAITNTTPSIVHLRATLPEIIKHLRALLRPSWDAYFMTLAGLASLRSNCMKRRVGAVLVTNREKRVLSTGYNGTPRGMRNCGEGGCARCNGTLNSESPSASASPGGLGPAAAAVAKCGVDLNECLCLHAEENALLEAGRERTGAGDGSTLYCNTCPCLRCSVKIVQCGVKEVVYSLGYSMDGGTAAVFIEAGVKLRQIKMPGN